MKTKSRVIPTYVLLYFLAIPVSHAQTTEDSSSDSRYWVHYTQGFSTLGAGSAIGIGVDYRHHVFSIRTGSADRMPATDTWDIGIMYGRSMVAGSWYLAGGVGAAVIAGEKYSRLAGGTAAGVMEPMLSFPVEGHLSRPLNRFFAAGIYSFLNINSNQPFGGIGASVRIGRLK